MSVMASHNKISWVALVLMSATLLISCKKVKKVEDVNPETLKTQEVENLTQVYSVNGKLSYRFETPLLERYELATQPFMEFRKGVKVETYNDSTHRIESELVADYAKFIEPLELWQARGNVVAKNDKGQILETQELFWDQKSDKIYSNVDSKITQGEDVIVGTGFESNSKFDDFIFRRPKGTVTVDTEPTLADSTDQANGGEGSVQPLPPPVPQKTSQVAPATASPSAVPPRKRSDSARPEPFKVGPNN